MASAERATETEVVRSAPSAVAATTPFAGMRSGESRNEAWYTSAVPPPAPAGGAQGTPHQEARLQAPSFFEVLTQDRLNDALRLAFVHVLSVRKGFPRRQLSKFANS
eukprot:2180490-Pleurochrysis_carterae.AAC.3